MTNSMSKSSHEKSPNLFNIFVEMEFNTGLFCIFSTKFCIKLTFTVTLDQGNFKPGTWKNLAPAFEFPSLAGSPIPFISGAIPNFPSSSFSTSISTLFSAKLKETLPVSNLIGKEISWPGDFIHRYASFSKDLNNSRWKEL